ncbi:hypothetical protein [Maritimibacter alexandrii]|uniref:hypothetical protein n=1 Tax=Maritimibacter alexandrii TaxID=2570355 RepID=UPI00110920A1|nr:hypothetical protein [Maritimibacter alexandrii]
MIRKTHIVTLVALCGLSAVLGYRVAGMGPPDPSSIVADWASVYARETGRDDLHCAGWPEGQGYVIECGQGDDKVAYVTDRYGALVGRRVGGSGG